MAAKIDANPTADGVDEAQALLDGKKADLKNKMNDLKDARNSQISDAVGKEFEAAVQRSSNKITGTMAKVTDPEMATKFQKLVKDWGDIMGATGTN